MEINNMEFSLEELMVMIEKKKVEKFSGIIKEIEKLGEKEKLELRKVLGWEYNYEWGGSEKVEELLNKGKIKFEKGKYNYEFILKGVSYKVRNLDKVKISFGRKVDLGKMIIKLESLGLKCKENYGIEIDNLESVLSKIVEIGNLVVSLK